MKIAITKAPGARQVHPYSEAFHQDTDFWEVREIARSALPAKMPWFLINGQIVHKVWRKVTKRQLVDNLIDLGVQDQFVTLLGMLSPTEKLRWDASPTISEDYTFLVEHRDMLLQVLNINDEQFDSIFDAH